MTILELIDDALDLVRRRWRMIAGVTILGCVVSVIVALNTPRVFEATEVIQVEHSMVSDDLVPAQGQTASARRIQSIQQRLMARDTILDIVDDLGVFDDMPAMSDADKVTAIRQSVTIEGQEAAREGYSDDGTLSVLSITANMDDPEDAQRVAHEFGQRTLDLSGRQRLDAARQTVDFFELQEQALRAEIAEVEDAFQQFRDENALSIPGTLDFVRDEIAGINSALREIERQIAVRESEIDRLSGSGAGSTVERRRAETLQAEIDDLTRERESLLDDRAALEARISDAPGTERELSSFQRELSGLQDQLGVVSTRLREAESNLALESRDQGGRLTVIEAATVPEYAVSRSRKATALIGGVASLGLAIGLAVLLEWLHPVIRTPGQMQRRFGLRPVVSVPALDVGPPRLRNGSRADDRRRGLKPR